jgi:hypothetical protein
MARAFGVDLSPSQCVSSVELVLVPNEAPKLVITRYITNPIALREWLSAAAAASPE